MFRQYRDLANARDHGGVQTIDVEQMECQCLFVVDFHRVDHPERRLEIEARVLANVVECELHIRRRNGHAVVPVRLAPEPDAYPTEVVGDHDSLGEVAVERANLVVRRNKQPIVEKRLGSHGMLDPGDRDALVQVGRKGVPVGAGRQHERAALGRVRVDVVEVLEIGRVLELAEK